MRDKFGNYAWKKVKIGVAEDGTKIVENASEKITEKLESEMGIKPTDVFIVINELPIENWGTGGKQKG